MRLTSKGQMTIPKHVRDAMGVRAGSNIGIEKNANGEFVLISLDARRAEESPGRQLVRELQDFGRRMRAEGKVLDLTTDEIMEMTRGPFNDLDPR